MAGYDSFSLNLACIHKTEKSIFGTMLYGIFSDVHSNLPALEAVFRSMESRGVQRRICLGDLVGYGADADTCVQKVAQLSDVCIIGNHDSVALRRESSASFNVYARQVIEWTQGQLSDASLEYLKKLPYVVEEERCTFVHASPMSPADWHYITNLDDALDAFDYFTTDFCFIGHTHNPVMVVLKDREIPRIVDGPAYRPQEGERILINVGSVGQPRDRDPRACWCLFDSEGSWIEYVRVEYDIKSAQAPMRRENFPNFLIERLDVGR